jgi:hypothetical protein
MHQGRHAGAIRVRFGWPTNQLQLLTPIAIRQINASGQRPPRTILTTHRTWSTMWRNWSGPHCQADARRNAKSAVGCHAVGQFGYAPAQRSKRRDRDAAEDQAERTVIDRIVELSPAGQSYRPIAATRDAEALSPRRARHSGYGRADRRIA